MRTLVSILLWVWVAIGCFAQGGMQPIVSGIYPHLAVTNNGGNECGIGAVVPWAGRLWFITYPAHRYQGSDDRLYSLDNDLELSYYAESPGGTHAGRMIHNESSQLIIGPCLIDAQGGIRCIPPSRMPGRITAVARHLADPANQVYFFTMEEGLYEVDVHSLEVRTLHPDRNVEKALPDLLPGDHGKAAYTAQGRLIVAQNGAGGVLAEWDGAADPGGGGWKIVDRNKYTEVTGPGGIRGSADDNAVAWAVGWDSRSVLLNVRQKGQWTRFRLPKSSATYDADSGWYTEWPRICDIGDGPLLLNAHGMYFDFPRDFTAAGPKGIRPIGNHLKMMVDATAWKGRIVMAANDASMQGNPLLPRPQSNLWFGRREDLARTGAPGGWGGVWLKQAVGAGEVSEPFLMAGFEHRIVHLAHEKSGTLRFALEIDAQGKGEWKKYLALAVPPKGYVYHILPTNLKVEWLRVRAEEEAASATVWFQMYSSFRNATGERSGPRRPELVTEKAALGRAAGLLRPLENVALSLGYVSLALDLQGKPVESRRYTVNGNLRATPEAESQTLDGLLPMPSGYVLDIASVRVVDRGRSYRLPFGERAPRNSYVPGRYRAVREVVSERSLANFGGTFYELPRAESGGLLKIRPICTHNRRLFDFASWRGMLVMAGRLAGLIPAGRLLRAFDGTAELWLGNVDDLWQIGPPLGEGGPWRFTAVKAGQPSDPYLMAGYDQKTVEFTHDSSETVRFTVEVDFLADGSWHTYDTFSVASLVSFSHAFPDGFAAEWVRVKTDRDCGASAQFSYR